MRTKMCAGVQVCGHLGRQCRKLSACWAGCTERPESPSSPTMPDRLIRGESCCISITTDRVSVSPLNLSLHAGRKGVQARAEEEGPAGREGEEVLAEAEGAGASTVGVEGAWKAGFAEQGKHQGAGVTTM